MYSFRKISNSQARKFNAGIFFEETHFNLYYSPSSSQKCRTLWMFFVNHNLGYDILDIINWHFSDIYLTFISFNFSFRSGLQYLLVRVRQSIELFCLSLIIHIFNDHQAIRIFRCFRDSESKFLGNNVKLPIQAN